MPAAPTILQPVNGGSYATNDPTFGISYTDVEPTGHGSQVQIQLSHYSDFTVTLEERHDFMLPGVFTSSITFYKAFRERTNELANTGDLGSGLWYMRARIVQWPNDISTSTWTATTSFTNSSAPYGSGLTPTNGVSVPDDLTNVRFAWSYNHPVGVPQQSYQIIIKRVSDNKVVWYSNMAGGIPGFQSSSDYFADVAMGRFDGTNVMTYPPGTIWTASDVRDQLLYWTLQLQDTDFNAGPVSAQQQFYVRSRPVPAITSDTTITHPLENLNWTFTAGGGRTQLAYGVQVYTHATSTPSTDQADLIYSSGFIGSDIGAFDPTGRVRFVNGSWYTIVLTVKDSAGLTGTDTLTAQATWSAPATPASITIDTTNHEASGYVRVTWPNTGKAGGFRSWDVYRKLTSEAASQWVRLVSDMDGSLTTHTFDDYTAPTSVSVDYGVVQVADTTGDDDPLESAFRSASATATTTKYWLTTYDDQPPTTIDLNNVISDSLTDEVEQAELLLIGRGRRREFGTNWGYRGTLAIQVRNTAARTARQLRLAINDLKDSRRPLLLRNPFGDIFPVAFDNIQFDRLAGVGVQEFGTLTIPYGAIAADDPTTRAATANRLQFTLDDAVLGRLNHSNRLA